MSRLATFNPADLPALLRSRLALIGRIIRPICYGSQLLLPPSSLLVLRTRTRTNTRHTRTPLLHCATFSKLNCFLAWNIYPLPASKPSYCWGSDLKQGSKFSQVIQVILQHPTQGSNPDHYRGRGELTSFMDYILSTSIICNSCLPRRLPISAFLLCVAFCVCGRSAALTSFPIRDLLHVVVGLPRPLHACTGSP